MNDRDETLEMLSSLIFRFCHILMIKNSTLHFKSFWNNIKYNALIKLIVYVMFVAI